jgi:mono/diheme cytochrome c family protein
MQKLRSSSMRRRWVRIILFFAAAMLAAGTARAQDIAAGKAIAQARCSNCHRVDPRQKATVRATAPTFLSIAQMTSTTEMSLAAFLTTPHGGMPNLILNREEIRDVSAYILSLRNSQ